MLQLFGWIKSTNPNRYRGNSTDAFKSRFVFFYLLKFVGLAVRFRFGLMAPVSDLLVQQPVVDAVQRRPSRVWDGTRFLCNRYPAWVTKKEHAGSVVQVQERLITKEAKTHYNYDSCLPSLRLKTECWWNFDHLIIKGFFVNKSTCPYLESYRWQTKRWISLTKWLPRTVIMQYVGNMYAKCR